MPTSGIRRRLQSAADWLDATPAETAGLAVLLAGASLVTALVWFTGTPRPATMPPPAPLPTAVASMATAAGELTVHVAGAVHAPGLVRLPGGARVADALEAAGGPLPGAQLDGLNLARLLTDGEQVVVPAAGVNAPAPSGAASPARPGGAWRGDGRLDLNRASVDELEELPGIGPVLAERIVDWREANGPFTHVGQLREVSGIGERIFQLLAERVTV